MVCPRWQTPTATAPASGVTDSSPSTCVLCPLSGPVGFGPPTSHLLTGESPGAARGKQPNEQMALLSWATGIGKGVVAGQSSAAARRKCTAHSVSDPAFGQRVSKLQDRAGGMSSIPSPPTWALVTESEEKVEPFGKMCVIEANCSNCFN